MSIGGSMRFFLQRLFPGSLALLLCAVALLAQPAYESGTLLDIQKKVELTPRSWLWDTPVTFSEIVRYELHVQLGNTSYLSEYVPLIQPAGPVPSGWKPNAPLSARVDKRRLFLKLAYDGEIETHILKRMNSP